MSDAVVALVAFEPDVVGGGADPGHLAVDFERCFPDAQVIARCDDLDGFGVSPAVILRTAEEVELAHRHRQVRFFRHALHETVKECGFHVGVDVNPARGLEDIFHLVFVADDYEIDHVTRIAGFVADAARDFCEECGIDARHSLDFLNSDEGRIRRIDFDVDFVGAVAGVDAHLVEANGEGAAGVRDDVALGADQERLREGGVTYASDYGAATRCVVGKNANEVFEIAREASGVGIGWSVVVVHFAGDGGDDVLAGLNGDAGVDPALVAGDGDVLRDAALAGGERRGWCSGLSLCCGSGGRLRRAIAAQELRFRDFGGAGEEAEGRNPNDGPSHPIFTHGCVSLGLPLRTRRALSVSRCV